jgi:hypothetical protein
MKECEGMEVQFHLPWPQHKIELHGQLHAPAALPPEERVPGTYCLGGWVDPRVGLNAVEKRKIFHCRESNPIDMENYTS